MRHWPAAKFPDILRAGYLFEPPRAGITRAFFFPCIQAMAAVSFFDVKPTLIHCQTKKLLSELPLQYRSHSDRTSFTSSQSPPTSFRAVSIMPSAQSRSGPSTIHAVVSAMAASAPPRPSTAACYERYLSTFSSRRRFDLPVGRLLNASSNKRWSRKGSRNSVDALIDIRSLNLRALGNFVKRRSRYWSLRTRSSKPSNQTELVARRRKSGSRQSGLTVDSLVP